jgi:hypothetical protein
MRSILFILGAILIIGWIIGIAFYALKGLFNIVLVLAVVSFILGFFNRSKSA